MATEAQLAEALRKADAAGDTESARHIADVIRSQRAKASQPAGRAKPTSFWQGFKEELAAGANNAESVLAATNPVMAIPRLAQRAITGKDNTSRGKRLDTINRSIADAPVQGSTLGRIAGGIVATAPTMLIPGIGGAGTAGRLLTQGAAQGGAGGAMLSRSRSVGGVARDAGIGAGAGALGAAAGRYVAAPIAERIGRTRPVRKIAEAAVNLANRATPRKVSLPPLPRYAPAERLVNAQGGMGDIRAAAADAQRLGLPLALADTDPRLRSLAGSAARFSPEVGAQAERELGARSLGQAGRAVDAIDDLLAPVTNIKERMGELYKAGDLASEPFYTAARARPAPVDDEIAAMLQTPAGKGALREAQTLAANEGRDPSAMGFDLNEQGEVFLRELPSFETLQYVKRGLDTVVEGNRDALGNLNLRGNPALQAVDGLRKRFNAKLGALNEDYARGNIEFAKFAKRRDALEAGFSQLPKDGAVPLRDFEAFLAKQTPETLPEAQRGYATAMSDAVSRQRYSSNPYNSVYGSPVDQGKVAALYPQGAPDFNRVYQLEGDMAKTGNQILGNSLTQARQIADAGFAGGSVGNDMVDMSIQAATGGGIPGALSVARRALGGRLKDRWDLGMVGAKAKADAIGPALLQQNPGAILAMLDEIMRKNAEMEARKAVYARAGGLLALPAASSSVVLSR